MAERWTESWGELVDQVVDAGVCTGCAGCVIACPKDVLLMDHESWLPGLEEEARVDGDRRRCVHADRGCTVCARVCPRFLVWKEDIRPPIGLSAFGGSEDVLGPYRAILLVQATDDRIAASGQDGGFGTAALVYALEHDMIDGALVSGFDGEQRPEPRLARTREEVLACAGSRYTYSANTLAIDEADRLGVQRLGLVSMGCQVSIPTIAGIRGARKLARRFVLNIGLLCSKTFTDQLYPDLLEAKYGIHRKRIDKVNIKGRLQVWHSGSGDDGYLEVPLKEARDFTRAGCTTCPDFTAEHADLSLGGIGRYPGRTLTIVRTELGAELVERMEAEGWITTSDATADDPEAVALVERLAGQQQRRWPIPEPA